MHEMVKAVAGQEVTIPQNMNYNQSQPRSGHAALVGPPLFLTMVFCFVLILVQQHEAQGTQAAAAKQSSDKSHSQLSPKYQPIDQIQPVVVSSPTAGASLGNGSAGSSSPQPNGNSGNSSGNSHGNGGSNAAPQAATQNNQPGNVINGVGKASNGILH